MSKAPKCTSKVKKSSLLIKVGEGKSYADMLGKLLKEVNPDDSAATVIGAWATAKSDVLTQLDAESIKKAFLKKVDQVIEDMGRVKAQRATLEDEIRAAVHSAVHGQG